MSVAFIVNARNKAALVARAVKGAISQTYPCEILLSDQDSSDGTYEAMQKAIDETPMPTMKRAAPPPDEFVLDREVEEVPRHTVRLLRCPIKGAYGMRACNQHLQWLIEQTSDATEWVFQCSADDYSLPRRVEVCMNAVAELKARGLSTAGIACTMAFENPERPNEAAVSGYPTESGYVSAGLGLHKMAYGSTIWGYRKDFLLKVGLDVPCTLDVYLGYLAALDRGYYVVTDPQHVHYMAADLDNMGFQGKMRAAERAGDQATIHRVNELNRFQLFELYYYTKIRQQELYPLAPPDEQNAVLNMLVAQGVGWYKERANLHKLNIAPSIL